MSLPGLTYTGPVLNEARLPALPEAYCRLLRELNGFVAFRGGLHVRGVCETPNWHSLAVAESGEHAIHRLFPTVRATDVPFAQDCLGDQFLLRDGCVYRLSGESGEALSLNVDFDEFLERANSAPVEFLLLQPLLQFEREGGRLSPNQSLMVYPPFITAEAARGISLSAVPKLERIAFLAHLARQLANVPDGAWIEIRPTD